MFTKEEAFAYVASVLGVSNAEEKITASGSERRKLLDEISKSFHLKVPFQNLRLLSSPPQERHRPSIEEIKSDFLLGIGGLCYNINVAAFFIFRAIGFRVVLVHAGVTSTFFSPNNHIIMFINDVEKEGDKFIVDVAIGCPSFRAVSLEFEKESPEYTDGYLEYKYVKHDGKILRMHRKGCSVRARNTRTSLVDFYIGEWRRYCVIDTTGTENLEDFDTDFDVVFTTKDTSPFHGSFRVIGYKDGKSVMVINQRILFENDQGDLESTEIEGGDEGVIATVLRLFPSLPEQMVRDAMTNYRTYA